MDGTRPGFRPVRAHESLFEPSQGFADFALGYLLWLRWSLVLNLNPSLKPEDVQTPESRDGSATLRVDFKVAAASRRRFRSAKHAPFPQKTQRATAKVARCSKL